MNPHQIKAIIMVALSSIQHKDASKLTVDDNGNYHLGTLILALSPLVDEVEDHDLHEWYFALGFEYSQLVVSDAEIRKIPV